MYNKNFLMNINACSFLQAKTLAAALTSFTADQMAESGAYDLDDVELNVSASQEDDQNVFTLARLSSKHPEYNDVFAKIYFPIKKDGDIEQYLNIADSLENAFEVFDCPNYGVAMETLAALRQEAGEANNVPGDSFTVEEEHGEIVISIRNIIIAVIRVA